MSAATTSASRVRAATTEPEPFPARAAITRAAAGIGLYAGAFGITFGAIAVRSGLSVTQAVGLSAVMFTGASQFALVGVLAAGGSVRIKIRECCEYLQAQLFVPGNVQFSPCEVLLTGIIANGDAQGKLAISFVRCPHIDVADQPTHDFRGFFAVVPQLSAVIVITGDGYPPRLGLADFLEGKIGCALAQCRRDAADVNGAGWLEPIRHGRD